MIIECKHCSRKFTIDGYYRHLIAEHNHTPTEAMMEIKEHEEKSFRESLL